VTDAPLQIPLRDFAIALFIGALVGIEREKRQEERVERGTGGLRTFIIIAEAGAVAAWLSSQLGSPAVFVGAGVMVTAALLAGYLAEARIHPRDIGLTTEAAAIVVYLLGGMTLFGHPGLAVALAIATSAVLAYRQPLHGAVERIGRDDLYAGLKLLIATFIVLPVLPDRALDPWSALNPYRMWWLVILISALSLVGYVATRWLGAGRGIALTGLFGGLVSSTAVTLSFARRSRDEAGLARRIDALAAGILISWVVMFARMGVLVALVNPRLLRPLAGALAAPTAIAAIGAALELRRGAGGAERSGEDVPLRNPFSLTAAIRFASLLAVVFLGVKLFETYLPGRGLYGIAALAGLTDVDAITLSMASFARDGGSAAVAATAIVIAALSNSLVKCGVVVALGAAGLGRRVAIATAALGAGAAAALFL